MKYYFSKDYDDGERCYTLQFFRDYMKENNLLTLELIEAKIETGTNYFYCLEFGEVGETGEGCGKICRMYAPRNGKNGRCRHHANCYIPTKNILTFKI